MRRDVRTRYLRDPFEQPNRVGSRHTLQAQRHPDGVERWREVHPRYVERFGPEASTNGPPEGHPVND